MSVKVCLVVGLILCGAFSLLAQEKSVRTYSAGKSDGFSRSEVSFTVGKIRGNFQICQGDDAVLTVLVEGSETYGYRWIKIEKPALFFPDTPELTIRGCGETENGKYYCEVTDLRTGHSEYSDTVSLKVVSIPELALSVASKQIARGASDTLNVSGASYFLWNAGDTARCLTVSPLKTTTYRVRGYNAPECYRDTSFTVEVVELTIDVGADRYTAQGDSVVLIAETEVDPVYWYKIENGRIEYVDTGRTLTVRPDKNIIYKAEVSLTGLTVSDSLAVYVLDSRFAGGGNDGFSQSEISFALSTLPDTLPVCQNDEVAVALSVTGTGIYRYRWVKMNAAGWNYTDTSVLVFPQISFSDTSRYYCAVTDVRSGYTINSDTFYLQVFTIPELGLTVSAYRLAAGANDTLTVSGAEYYQWQRGEVDAQLIVAPQETTTYRVRGHNTEFCYRDTSFTVEVVKLTIDLGPDRYAARGDSVVLIAKTEAGPVYWYKIENGRIEYVDTGRILTVRPGKNIVYKAEISLTGLTASDSLTVYVMDRQFAGGANDGFALSRTDFTISPLPDTIPACLDDKAVIAIEVAGTGVYRYQWVKMEDSGWSSADTSTVIFAPVSVSDSAHYYCKVTDVTTGTVKYSDTFYLQLFTIPDLQLTASALKIPSGMNDTLTASGAVYYQWQRGGTDARVIVAPMVTTTYRVRGYNIGVCYRDTSVTIEVADLELTVNPDRYITAGDTTGLYAIAAVDPVRWYQWQGGVKIPVAIADSVTVAPGVTTVYEAEIEFMGVTKTAQVTVFVKSDDSYAGGASDGFDERKSRFQVGPIQGEKDVCLGDTVRWWVNVNGEAFSYLWVKINEPGRLFDDSAMIAWGNCRLEDTSRYYCKVTDLRTGNVGYSDTVALRVLAYPAVHIGSPLDSALYCSGDVVRLDASSTEDNNVQGDDYVYRWRGPEILDNRDSAVVNALPRMDAVYYLAVDNRHCTSYDTVRVRVYHPYVDIPSDLFVVAGERLMIQAVAEDSAVLNWYAGNPTDLVQQSKAAYPLDYGPVYGSLTVYVESTGAGCRAVDSCRVEVKQGGAFHSGENDGFDEAVAVPYDLPEITISGGGEICRGDTAEIRLVVSGGIGTWGVWINRASDGRVADEIWPGYPLELTARDTVLKFVAITGEKYYVSKIKDYYQGSKTLTGSATNDTATVTVHVPVRVTFGALPDNRIGMCDSVDLFHKLKPSANGIRLAENDGVFYADGRELAGKWWEKDSLTPGEHKISYWYAADAVCPVISDTLKLIVDTLPGVTVALPEYTCANVSDTLSVHFSGSGSFRMDMEVLRANRDGIYRNDHFKGITVPGPAYRQQISWLDGDSLLVYKISGVTDRYGCPASDSISDTIYYHYRPVLAVASRPATDHTAAWLSGLHEAYTLASADSLLVRITQVSGLLPWNLVVLRDDLPYLAWQDMARSDTLLSLKEEGKYKLFAGDDRYCGQVSDTHCITIARLHPGYMRMKVLLDGPVYEDGKMRTGIENALPLYGITSLPAVGQEVIDWIGVELRSGTPADSVARMNGGSKVFARDTCLVLADGTVVDRFGRDTIELREAYSGAEPLHGYYVVLYHRNHLSVMSRNKYRLAAAKDSVGGVLDFTDSVFVYLHSARLADHMSVLPDGKWALSAGIMNGDNLVSVSDVNYLVTKDAFMVSRSAVYTRFDMNFDGRVDWDPVSPGIRNDDWNKIRSNRNKYTEIRFR